MNMIEARPTSDASDRKEYFQMYVNSSDSLTGLVAVPVQLQADKGTNCLLDVLIEASAIKFCRR